MSQEVTKDGKKYARITIEKWKPEFKKVLQGIDSQYFTTVAITAIQNSPQLLECNLVSWYTALRQAAQLSLPVDGSLGLAYLVPFKEKATLIIGYKGLRELVYRTGLYVDIQAQCVFSNDEFELELGLNQKLKHIPTSGDPGEVIGAYVMVVRADGKSLFHFMWLREILKIRDNYSQAYKYAEKSYKGKPAKKDSMWHTDPERAYEKTVLRAICGNRLQLSVVAQRVMNREEKMNAGFDPSDEDGIIDIDPDAPEETPMDPEPETANEKGVDGMVDAIKNGKTAKTPEVEPVENPNQVDLRIVIREEMEIMFPNIPFGSKAFDQKIDELCATIMGRGVNALYSWKKLSTEELVKLWNGINGT